jgi:hypothetical protein
MTTGEQSVTQLCGRPSPFAAVGPCTQPAGHIERANPWHAHLDRAKAMETRWHDAAPPYLPPHIDLDEATLDRIWRHIKLRMAQEQRRGY